MVGASEESVMGKAVGGTGIGKDGEWSLDEQGGEEAEGHTNRAGPVIPARHGLGAASAARGARAAASTFSFVTATPSAELNACRRSRGLRGFSVGVEGPE